ncbi:hypothetical protein CBS101457_005798 [Exobasidium rhododendri]|nr:hypothetical protein CBS101457_005798 [Exobasidium rhododendri]
MVSIFCVGVGELLTFAAMVLAILVNMGQISNNIVARSIYYTELDTTGFTVSNAFASSQSAPELAGNGLKYNYRWGLYNFCAGEGSVRSCARRNFGYEYQPLNVLEDDASSTISSQVPTAISAATFSDSKYLGKFSKPANYLAFVGTVVIGASFLVAFLAHRFAFLIASLLALAAAGCMFVAAAIWTAIIYKVRSSLHGGNSGLTVNYGNAIWMEWAAAAAAALSVIPLLVACISGRKSKY